MSSKPSLLITLGLLACATSADQGRWADSMRTAPLNDGVSHTFSADYAKTLSAAENALQTAGLSQYQDCPYGLDQNLKAGEHVRCIGLSVNKVDTVDDHTAILFANKYRGSGDTRWWNGDQARVLIQEVAPNQTTVRVLSKFRTKSIVDRPGDYSGPIFKEMERRLK